MYLDIAYFVDQTVREGWPFEAAVLVAWGLECGGRDREVLWTIQSVCDCAGDLQALEELAGASCDEQHLKKATDLLDEVWRQLLREPGADSIVAGLSIAANHRADHLATNVRA